MSYFEYIINGDLTPEFEEKTKQLQERLNNGTAFYNIQKYTDEEIAPEKKMRTLVLTAPHNIWIPLFELLKGCGLNFTAYYKQRII